MSPFLDLSTAITVRDETLRVDQSRREERGHMPQATVFKGIKV